MRISARWPFRGLSVGDFSPRGLSWVIFATRTVVGDFRPRGLSSMRISTRWPFRGLSGDFCPRGEDIRLSVGDFSPRGLSSVRISTRWPFRGLSGAIKPTRTVRRCAYQHVGPSVDCRVIFSPRGQYISTHINRVGPSVDYPWVIFASRGLSVGDFRHEDCPSSKYINTFTLPWTVGFKFRRSKGSIGHAFTVRIRTENQNQTSFYPFVPHEISVLVELILGHLRYLLTDVPPQPNSPPDNVLRRIDPRASLGSKEVVVTPPPIHGVILSWLFGAGKARKSRSQSVPGRRGGRSRHVSGSSSTPTHDGFGTGTPDPSPQSHSNSRIYGSNMPTTLAYNFPSTRGCSPWRPDAVMKCDRAWRLSVLRIFKGAGMHGHHAACGALPAAGPYLRLSRFQEWAGLPFTWNLSPLRPSKFSFEYLLLPPRSAPAAAPPGSRPRFCSDRAPSYSSRPGSCPAAGIGRASAPSISGLVDSAALGGIYRPIGAAFPNNPTRRQRLRGATGSNAAGLSPSLAPLSRNLGPRVIRLTWGRVEDFGSSRAFGRSGGDLASEFTTACQGAPGILSSDFGQRRAVTRETSFRPISSRGLGAAICDTQAGVPSARRLGAQLAFKDFDGSRDSAIHTKYRISLEAAGGVYKGQGRSQRADDSRLLGIPR
ncbi:hypothetical protein Bca101_100916 [Brassica carinata]